jgi:hypothetical protein
VRQRDITSLSPFYLDLQDEVLRIQASQQRSPPATKMHVHVQEADPSFATATATATASSASVKQMLAGTVLCADVGRP